MPSPSAKQLYLYAKFEEMSQASIRFDALSSLVEADAPLSLGNLCNGGASDDAFYALNIITTQV